MVRRWAGHALMVSAVGLAFALPAFAGEVQGGGSASPPTQCDADCLRANAERASLDCAPRIEASAPGDFDWMNRPLPGIFQQADTSDPGSPVVRYRGDSIRFMDPKGTWQRISYECVYDVGKHAVVGVNVRPGRLDRPPPKPIPVAKTRPLRLKYGEPSPVEIQQAPPNLHRF